MAQEIPQTPAQATTSGADIAARLRALNLARAFGVPVSDPFDPRLAAFLPKELSTPEPPTPGQDTARRFAGRPPVLGPEQDFVQKSAVILEGPAA